MNYGNIEQCIQWIDQSVSLISTLDDVSLGEAIDILFEMKATLESELASMDYMSDVLEELLHD